MVSLVWAFRESGVVGGRGELVCVETQGSMVVDALAVLEAVGGEWDGVS